MGQAAQNLFEPRWTFRSIISLYAGHLIEFIFRSTDGASNSVQREGYLPWLYFSLLDYERPYFEPYQNLRLNRI